MALDQVVTDPTSPNWGQSATATDPADPNWGRQPDFRSGVIGDTSMLDRLGEMLSKANAVGPMVGGAVGGIAGGVPGAAVGGAAGEGYQQLFTHLRELFPALGDLSTTVRTQPGAVLRGAASGMAEGATDAGLSSAMQAAYDLGGKYVMKGASTVGKAVYRGYLKPSLSKVNLPKAAEIVKTAIAENLPMTHGGLTRANELISQLNSKVNDILSKATGRTVDLGDVANDVRAWAKRMYDRPGRDPKDYKAVLKVADRIDKHPSQVEDADQVLRSIFDSVDADGRAVSTSQGGPSVTLSVANQVKRDLQASAADKFGLPNVSAEIAGEKYASSRARRAVERGATGLTDAAGHGVGALNMRESKLIDVARALARATGRDANRDQIIGTRAIVGGLVGGTVGGGSSAARGGSSGETAIASAVGSIVGTLGLHPAVATRAAILAAKIGQRMPGWAAADVARAAVQAVLETEQRQETP